MSETEDLPAVLRIRDLVELVATAPGLSAEDRIRMRGLMPPAQRDGR